VAVNFGTVAEYGLSNISAAVYEYAAGSQITLDVGIFENGFRAFDLGGVPVESNTPQLTIDAADVPNPARGDTVTINDVGYVVRDIRPDGEGWTVLVLSES
jgi:hypothetical protein